MSIDSPRLELVQVWMNAGALTTSPLLTMEFILQKLSEMDEQEQLAMAPIRNHMVLQLGRIARCITTLGGADDQSPYHSELASILLIMDVVKKIYTLHNIACEEIKIGCDGLFALNKAFSHVSLLILYGPNYNLFSPHTWKIRHGYSHQDDHASFEQLNQ
jgi:hypothetical protein